MGVEERAEPVIRNDQGAYCVDGFHSGASASGGLARQLANDVAVAAEGQHYLVAVLRHGKDLDKPGYQHEHMGGWITLDAYRRAGLENLHQAQSPQELLLGVVKKTPESLRGYHPVLIHITERLPYMPACG